MTSDIMDKDEFLQLLGYLATPIDFEALTEQGVIIRRGAWYEVKDFDRLPEHARRKISTIQSGSDTPLLVKFRKPKKSIVKRYEQLSGDGETGELGT